MPRPPIDGIAEVTAFLDRIPKELGRGVTTVVNAMLGPVSRQMKKFITPIKRSGLLRKSLIKTTRVYKSGVAWGGVGPDKQLSGTHRGKTIRPRNYAHLVNLGTKPHTIKFKNRNRTMLHPGTKPVAFQRPALAASKAEAIRKGEEQLAKVLAKIKAKGK